MKITLKNLQKKIALRPARIRKAAKMALSVPGLDKLSGKINLCFAGDSLVRRLNSRYHDRDRTTDVLAFDIRPETKGAFLADIIISADTAKRNARRFGTSLDHELCLYAVHGILHLAGYDHKTASQKRRMDKKTNAILKKIIL